MGQSRPGTRMMSVTRLAVVYSIFLVFTVSGSPPLEGDLVSNDHVLPPRRRVVTRVAPRVDEVLVRDTVLPARRKVLTRVVPRVEKNRNVHVTHEVHHVVHKKPRKRVRPIRVVSNGVSTGRVYDGSYVAVSGTNGRGAVHVVDNVPALGRDSVSVINGVRVRYRPNRRVVEVAGNNRGVVQVVGNNRGVVQVVPDRNVVQVVGRRAPPPVVHPSTRVLGGTRGVVLAGDARNTQVVVDRRQNTPQVVVQPVAIPYPTGQGGFGGVFPNQQTPQATSPVLTGDRLPLPECSYVNTDFPGDDIILSEDGSLGINSGSARACKARCKLEASCLFWTYKEGFNRDVDARDCFLKEGTPGLPVPRDAVPRIGFVSGTPDNNCICITSEDESDQVCPLQDLPGGGVYPWQSTDPEAPNNAADGRIDQNLNNGGIYNDPRFFGRNAGVGNTGIYGNTGINGNTGVNNRLDPKFARRDPFFPPVQLPNGRASIEASVRSLRDQLDILSTKLGGQTSQRDL